jgi:CRISPR/Cas system endoribonuclease Cas6 (RAMP superfamily)
MGAVVVGSVLLVEETGENHRPTTSHWQTVSPIVVSSTPRHERDSNSQR